MAMTVDTHMHDNAHEIAAELWRLAELPETSLERLELPEREPLLPSSFRVAQAAQATIGVAALAATEIESARHGHTTSVSVDRHAAERECTGLFKLNGTVPDQWAPFSGLYPTQDGHVRIHANFDHHRDGALKILRT